MRYLKHLSFLSLLILAASCGNDDTLITPNDQLILSRTTTSAIPLVDELIGEVIQLENEGELTANISSKIQTKLTKAKNKLEQNKANKAINKLNNLKNYITRKVNKGKISLALGTELLNKVDIIIEEISLEDNDDDGYTADEDCDDNNAVINPDNTSGQAVFDALTMETIMSQSMGSEDINADDNETNLIPPGAIVVYKTKTGRFGKFIVETYGYNLTISWLTYDSDGSTLSHGSDLLVRGTFSINLDSGTEASTDDADFFWQQITNIERAITPLDGSALALFACE